jgi:hypothetical protein
MGQEKDSLRHLERAELRAGERLEFVFAYRLPGPKHHGGVYLFSVFLVGDAERQGVLDGGIGLQDLVDRGR